MKQLLFFSIILLIYQTLAAQEDTTQIQINDRAIIPVITISEDDLESEQQSQDISGLLQSSRDIFTSTAGYTFGPVRFRVRGFDSENTTVMINGIPVNDIETGRPYWSVWGGLNDAVRNKEIQTGLTSNKNYFSGIGGYTNMITRASTYAQGTKFVYSLSNRSYRQRLMVTSSTGMMENGLAATVSFSRRWANQGYIEGTFYDAYSYFVSLEKKFNNKHSIGLIAFGAPKKNGKPGGSTQEAYDLAGTNYYNPYWGYQQGEVRNSRINNYHQPKIMLSDYFSISDNIQLNTTLTYSFGRGGSTRLNWYDAYDPRPDYYRYLPSYRAYEDADNPNLFYEQYRNQWESGEAPQIDWDLFYFANRKNLYGQENANGTDETVTGNLANYFIEENRIDHQQINFHSVLENQLNDNINLSTGVNVTIHKGEHFNVMYDLLGADFWVDIDKFAEGLGEDDILKQNDLQNPNRIVYEGDIFGNHYIANVNKYELFGQAQFNYAKVDFFGAAFASYQQMWRTGKMQNGKFPDNSLGDSEKLNFFDYGLTTGFTYKITGRHFLTMNGAYQTRAPFFRSVYLSPRTRDHTVDNPVSEKILSADANYFIRLPHLKARFSGYYAKFMDQPFVRSLYHDIENTFVNYIMTGVDKEHMGVELGVEAELFSGFSLTGVLAHGQYLYKSRPTITVVEDNSAEVKIEGTTAYLNNFHIGGRPETAASFGIKYWAPSYWFGGASVNYFDNIYLDVFSMRRTEEGVYKLEIGTPYGDEQRALILDQTKLDPGYTVDLFIGKSLRIDYTYYINISLNVSNLLDNTDFATGGYEQYRFDPEFPEKFDNKLFYLYGRTFFLNASFRF